MRPARNRTKYLITVRGPPWTVRESQDVHRTGRGDPARARPPVTSSAAARTDLGIDPAHKKRQAKEREATGAAWHDDDLVFCHENGDGYTAGALNWRFSKMTKKAGIGHWHPREGRHTAVSIMSSNGVPIQDISDTVGHMPT